MLKVFISISQGNNPVSLYFFALAEKFVEDNFHVVFIFDKQVKDLPSNTQHYTHLTWPSYRPSKIKDFLFLNALISEHRPSYCIAIFGSVNVMMIVSYLRGVKNRIAWIRTTNTQVLLDSKNQFLSKLKVYRKALVYKLSNQINTNSNGTLLDAIKTFRIHKTKIKVLPNLIEPSKLTTKSFFQREMAICVVGRLDKSKGHEILLGQFVNVIKLFPDLKLHVIGSGPEMDNLVSLSKSLRLYKSVIFHGTLPYSSISACFSNSLIGVSASHSEAFGWVNIESLREGTPIISTKTEGAMDILSPAINGEFFNLDDLDSLKIVVERILQNWNSYSKSALSMFHNKFSFESKIHEHYLEVKSNSV